MTCQDEPPQDQTPDPISESAHLCSPDKTVEAVILYPSLGMPMVLGPKKEQEPKSEKYSLIIATGEKALSLFDVQGKEWEAMGAYVYIDQYLHLTPINEPKHAHARKEGGLCKAGTAQDSIHVWHLGEIKDGMLVKHGMMEADKRKFFPFAVLASRLFGSRNPCESFDPADIFAPRKPCEPKKPYEGMTHLWEVEIDLLKAGLRGKITSDEFLNWAWLVEMPKDCTTPHTGNFFFDKKFKHYEPQDRMIDDYLRHLVDSDKHYDPAKLFEVNLLESSTLPGCKLKSPLPQALANEYVKRLQSWHPVIRATNLPLKLAHLTDMHVNVRQDVLAKSEARVIDDVSENSVGDKVAHAFRSFKGLIEQMAERKKKESVNGVDTALLLTGDYIDYNRNINPREVEQGIGEQWKAFNILANQNTPGKYQRGLDNTLVYSLVRYAYTEHKMPVFMVSGNHEPYQFPYGISPRLNLRLIMLGLLELINFPAEWYKKWFTKGGSQWANWKIDERISADHNLTIYEATLAYGPTYAQVMTSENFDARQYDLFHTLLTPFSDAVLALGGDADKNGENTQQILALLGWGSKENLLNLGDLLPLGDVDAQWFGILPRASQSFSEDQQSLLKRAKKLKKNSKRKPPPHFIVASHFPMVSYKLLTAFDKELTFTPRNIATGLPFTKEVKKDAAFNEVNEGTCELNQHWFYQDMVFNKTENVDWHISGHSHRAGVYHVKKVDGSADVSKLHVESAHDPDLQRAQIMLVGKGTNFVVSGSAGPLGKQNLKGEFGGWMTRPPSGSWIDMSVQGHEKVEQVKVIREKMNEKPRLCVILDYMAVMSVGKDKDGNDIDIVPIRFAKSHVSFEEIKFTLSEEMLTRKCLNLMSMKIWLFQPKNEKSGISDEKWIPINGSITKGKKTQEGRTEYALDLSDIKNLDRYLVKPSKYVLQAFCVIPLKQDGSVGRGGLEGLDGSGELKDVDPNGDLNRDDPWIFPLEIGVEEEEQPIANFTKTSYCFRRPLREKGEVPDWWFRYKFFKNKGYVSAYDVIFNKGATNGDTTSSTPPPLPPLTPTPLLSGD